LTDLFLNVQPLKERSENGIELIGVKVVGDTDKKYNKPFELWSIYSGPSKKEAQRSSKMIRTLCKERKSRALLAGDFNCNLMESATGKGGNHGKALRTELEKMEEEGEARILNEYGAKTTPLGTVIDLAVTMGDWEEGFAYPIEWHLGSTHFPVCVGVNTEELETTKAEYIDIPSIRRTKKAAKRIQTQCAVLCENIQEHTENTLAQAILDAIKDEATDEKSNKKKKKQKHWWSEEIESIFLRKQKHLAEHGKDKDFNLKRLKNSCGLQLMKQRTKASKIMHQG